MKALLKFVIDPTFVILLFLSLAWFFRKNKKLRNAFWVFNLVLIVFVWISPFPYSLARCWERKYNDFKINDLPTRLKKTTFHIIILGAGYKNDPALSIINQLDSRVALRLLEGLRIYNLLGNKKLISSGSAVDNNTSQAQAVAEAAVALGVLPEDTLYLPDTINTESEALSYSHRFANQYQVVLVTDAIHMRRAMFWFKYYGIDPIAAPCNYRFKEDPERPEFKWWPSYKKIKIMDLLLHEWFGLLWAKFKTKYLQ